MAKNARQKAAEQAVREERGRITRNGRTGGRRKLRRSHRRSGKLFHWRGENPDGFNEWS